MSQKLYKLQEQEYTTLDAVREVLNHIAFPANPSDELLQSMGVIVEERPDPVPDPQVERMFKEQAIREERNRLLAETDYLLMPDYPLSEEELVEVKAYRQQLRDLTEQEGFPDSVVFPPKPYIVFKGVSNA